LRIQELEPGDIERIHYQPDSWPARYIVQAYHGRAAHLAHEYARYFPHALLEEPASHGLQRAWALGLRTVQELLGHRDVSTTMLYTHVLNRGGLGVRSPADRAGLGDLIAGMAD
jgi:integrase